MFKKILLLSVMLFMTGCVSSGLFVSSNQTVVELREGNFNIVATDVSGESSASYLIGVSVSNGFMTQTLSLIKLNGPDGLYQQALKDLWKNVEKKVGKVEGRSLALTNVRYDTQISNFLIFNKVKLMVRADVISFP
ncbi:MAG TPA: hypothetical protein ENL21_04180 [Caldithrix abyssi]|uniref:Lipoprotein n=1 Tax=Caldithrix abyssi TaxID=187145 RepID=A0A7V5LJF9_CALAY|nr:hypothetical protein [Caldithrix abyssi]